MSSKTLWGAAALGWAGVCGAAYFVESQSVWLWLLISCIALVTIQLNAILLMAAGSWLGSGPATGRKIQNGRAQAVATVVLAGVAILTAGGAALWRVGNAVLLAIA